jgi:hypothetical protein
VNDLTRSGVLDSLGPDSRGTIVIDERNRTAGLDQVPEPFRRSRTTGRALPGCHDRPLGPVLSGSSKQPDLG